MQFILKSVTLYRKEVMEILLLIVGLVIGTVAGWLIWGKKASTLDGEVTKLTRDIAEVNVRNASLTEEKSKAEASQMLAEQKTEQAEKLLGEAKDKTAALEKKIETLNRQLTDITVKAERTSKELDDERTHTAKEKELRQQQFNQQMETLKEQFTNLAAKMLENTSGRLQDTNSEAMENITKPLRENIKQLQEAIHNTNSETAKSTASLSEQLRAMSEQTTKIDRTATMLTNVIKGGNKAQGNWGERLLTDILDAQGFKCGIDYDVQQTITDDKGNIITNDESGKRMIPDVILHYPNNEDVVIDSKMSVEAYYEYVNSDNETARRRYADDLVRSIRTQATGLAKKDYSRYIQKPRRAIDFVIMFVPNEGALQLALAHDPKLWREAFDRHVFITSQQNLMAILKIIQITWRQYAQTENQKKVFDIADEMMKRVGEFIKRFDKLRRDIDTLNKDYEDAYNKAYTGRQSIVQKANELKALGAKVSATYPIREAETDLLEENGKEEK